MDTLEPTVRVKSIKVESLFGLYNHLITLKDDRVTVVHGPNGVGKTVLLKLTNSFLSGRYNEIVRIPFKSFEILFDDNSVAKVTQEISPEPPNGKKVHISFQKPGEAGEKTTLASELLSSEKIAASIAESSPYLTQIGPEQWMDRRTEEVMSADELIASHGDKLDKKNGPNREPKGLRLLRAKINVHLIEAQRLIRLTPTSHDWRYRTPDLTTTATVQEYSRDLKRRLESTLANYAKQSQKLDQTFPQRLLEGKAPSIPLEELKKSMNAIEEQRSRLKRIGILESAEPAQDLYPLQISQLDSLQDAQLSVMSVYAKDTQEKLAVLEELAGRVELLLGVLNRKFTNKTVSISRETGVAIFGTDGKPIPITALSSGEQHELVLLYDLLFKVKANTLVLIDEPELSLHISWQKGFMDDLLEIIRLAHFDVLMATHSPYIVGDRSDLMVVLSPDLAE